MLYKKGEKLSEVGARTARLASFLVLSTVIVLIIYGLMFIAIARLLGPSSYGIYVIAVGVVGAFIAVSNFGIGTYISRHVPYLANTKGTEAVSIALGDGFLLLVTVSTAMAVVGMLLAPQISSVVFHSSTGYTSLLYVALASVVLNILYSACNSALVGFGDGPAAATASIVSTLTQAITGIGLVFLGFGATGAVSGLFFGALAGIVLSVYFISRHGGIKFVRKGIAKRLKHVLSFSLPIAGSNFMMPIFGSNFMTSMPPNLAVLLLGIFSLPSVVGNYGVAARAAGTIAAFMGAITLALLPMFSAVFSGSGGKSKLRKLYKYSVYAGLLFVMPLVAYFVVFSHSLMLTVFPQYTSAYIYIALMSAGVLLQLPGAYANFFLISEGKTRKVLYYSTIVGLVEMLLAVVLIPYAGAIGAIIALYFLGSIFVDYLYVRDVAADGSGLMYGKIARVVAANLLLALVLSPVFLISGISSTARLLIGIVLLPVLYPPIVALFGAFDKEDSKLLSKASKRIPVISAVLPALFSYAGYFMR